MGKKRLRVRKKPAAVLFICMLFVFGAVLACYLLHRTEAQPVPTGAEPTPQRQST